MGCRRSEYKLSHKISRCSVKVMYDTPHRDVVLNFILIIAKCRQTAVATDAPQTPVVCDDDQRRDISHRGGTANELVVKTSNRPTFVRSVHKPAAYTAVSELQSLHRYVS